MSTRNLPGAAIGAGTPYPLWSRGFWRGYWITLRPYLFFVSGASGLVGLALAPGLGAAPLWIAFAAFFLSYGLGQALTDVTQTDTDAISSPYRPLVRGEITSGQVLGVSLGGLALCGAVLAALNPWTLALSVACVAGLATYTPFKRRWWGGPPWNSWIVAMLPAMGMLCGGGGLGSLLASPALGLAMASVFGTYAVFVILGYLKDVDADCLAAYATLPVRFGRRTACGVSLVFAALGIAASGLLLAGAAGHAFGDLPSLIAGGLWTAGAIVMLGAHAMAWRVRRDEDAHPAIAASVRGYLALHLGEAAWLRPDLAVPAVLLFLLFELALAARPSRAQI